MNPAAGSDPLTYDSPAGICWTRTNMAEVTPGILTAAGWSFYGRLVDINSRRAFHDLGLLPAAALDYPADVGEHIIGVFHGRASMNVTVLRSMMSGFPGVSGDDVERDILGSTRPGVTDDGYGRRLPAVLAKAPLALLRSDRYATDCLARTRNWWSTRFGPEGIIDGTPARQALTEAVEVYGLAIRSQSRSRMLFQGATSQIVALTDATGHPQLTSLLLSGSDQLEELSIATDLNALAQDTLTLEAFVARHGFLGPNGGDITAHSWRENPAPVQRLAATLRARGGPARRRDDAARIAATTTVLASLPRHRRPGARITFAMMGKSARTLERSKMAFVMSIDGARAAIRALGAELTAAGHLDQPDDAFHLFVEELLDPAPTHLARLAGLVAERQATRKDHQQLELVDTTWQGNPAVRATTDLIHREVTEVTGHGASHGIVEGIVKVVLDAGADTQIDDGDILVCPTTDPSWVSIMTIADALVVDIGGLASHGAVVARELGLPCVVGTTTGTTDLHTGDRVRVDGATGIVTILERG